MKTIVVVILLASLVLEGGCSPAQEYVRAGFDFARIDRVAVVGVHGDIENPTVANQIAEYFAAELREKGYVPLGLSDARKQLASQRFSQDEFARPGGAVRAGLILDVPAVLTVEVPNAGEQMSISAKLINVETGGVLWMGSATGRPRMTIKERIAELRYRIKGQQPPEPPAPPEGAMPARKARQARELISRVCRGLPPRPRQGR